MLHGKSCPITPRVFRLSRSTPTRSVPSSAQVVKRSARFRKIVVPRSTSMMMVPSTFRPTPVNRCSLPWTLCARSPKRSRLDASTPVLFVVWSISVASSKFSLAKRALCAPHNWLTIRSTDRKTLSPLETRSPSWSSKSIPRDALTFHVEPL